MNNQNTSVENSNAQNQGDSNKSTLEQISPRVGDSVQLQLGNHCYVATLIGFLINKSFIVTVPTEKEPPFQPREGESLTVRFLNDKRAYAFSTQVFRLMSEPFPHLHLNYPSETRALKERQHDRVRVNISGTAAIPDGRKIDCFIHDISIGGALIAINGQTGALNDPLLLTLHVAVNGVDYELSLDSQIRSVRMVDAASNNNELILHGLAFQDLSRQDILALAAFDLLPDWIGSK